MQLSAIALLSLAITSAALAAPPADQEIKLISDIAYKSDSTLSDYEKERCKLDVYLPGNIKDFATLVWFHGGGLTAGKKDNEETAKIARGLASAGLGVVVPNYRLSPKAKFPAYLQDSATAFAWAHKHIAEYGGNASRLYIAGHSAGGYIALMLGMDTHYLEAQGLQPSAVAGYIPISGQTMTHYTVRDEQGGAKLAITADKAAPVHFARKDTPPFLVLYADNDMAARAEENAYFVALMKGAGNKLVTGQLITDRTHGSIAHKIAEPGDPARQAILDFVRSTTGSQ